MTTALDDLATDLAFGIGRHWCGPLPPEHYDGSTRSRLNGTTNSILVLLTSGGGFTDVSLTPKTAPNVDLGDRYLNRVWSRPDLPDDEHERALLERLREIVDHHTEAHPGQPTTAVMGW